MPQERLTNTACFPWEPFLTGAARAARGGLGTLTLCAPGAPLMMTFLLKCTEDGKKKAVDKTKQDVGLTACPLLAGDTARPGYIQPSKVDLPRQVSASA